MNRSSISVVMLLLAILGFGLAGGLVGCSYNSGPSERKLQSFKIVPGQTTQSELIAHFGNPTTSEMLNDGTEIMIWAGVNSTTNWGKGLLGVATFHLAGGNAVSSQTHSLQVRLKNGVVVNNQIVNSQY